MKPIIPQSELDPDLFDFPEYEAPRLHPQVRAHILSGLARLNTISPLKWVVMYGKCCKTPDKTSPVTILVGLEQDDINQINTMSLNMALDELNDKYVIGTRHPLKYVLTTDALDLNDFDRAFAPIDNQWTQNTITEKNQAILPAHRRRQYNRIAPRMSSKNQDPVADLYKNDPNDLSVAAGVFQTAQNNTRGTWPISIGQAKDLVDHFGANMPTSKRPQLKLGNTGIILSRPSKDKFLLIKNG